MTTKPPDVTVEVSHGRPRLALRRPTDGGTTALPDADDAGPLNDPVTGRFTDPKAAARRRWLKRRAEGVATLDPARCVSWLSPYVKDGGAYGAELLARFNDPALARLVGATADAHTVFRGLLALGAAGDPKALVEARAWLREHRACLRELSVLAGLVAEHGSNDDPDPWETPR